MTAEQSVTKKNSLAARLFKAIFPLYILGAVAITVCLMAAGYLSVKQDITEQIRACNRAFSDGLATALWESDSSRADAIVAAMAGMPGIVAVEVFDRQSGTIFSSSGKLIQKKEREPESEDYNPFSSLFWETFPLKYTLDDGRTELGALTIYSSGRVVWGQVWPWFTLLAFGGVVKIALLGIIFFWFGRKIIGRPLLDLADETRGLSLSGLNDCRVEPGPESQDELAVLKQSLARMIENLKADRENLVDREKAGLDLRRARMDAEAADRAKGEFLARMSHEIRTPMNAIIGLTELAMKTGLSTRQKDYLSKIKRSSDSLLAIINDILDFSTIESEGLELEPVDFNLENMIQKIGRFQGEAAAEKKLELLLFLDPHIPEILIGDAVRIRQMLMNLIDNAIKFTIRGEIVVRIVLEEIDADRAEVLFSVTDTGIGIAPENIPVLFEPFTQEDGSSSRKFGGSGLGLSVVKRILDTMDRNILVSSQPGKGSTFSFRVGFGYRSSAPNPREESPKILRNKKILVVEGQPTAREILSGMLDIYGFEVGSVDSFEEAVEALEASTANHPFDLVIMNWIMPGLDGLEATRKIRENPLFGQLPAVIVSRGAIRSTGLNRFEMMDRVVFLPKPLTPAPLLMALVESFQGVPAIDPGQKPTVEPVNGDDPGKIRGARILVVEDNPVNLQVAVEILTKEGFRVDVAVDGNQAIEKVSHSSYDCILMDVEMPGMDGHKATRLIREKLGLVNLPIIAMTAHTLKGDREKCLEAGMNDYLPKPVSSKQLFSALVKWIPPGPDLGTEISPADPCNGPEADLVQCLPGFDLENALDRIEGHADIYLKILKEFYQEFASAGRTIRESLNQGDTDTCRRLVHNLKGGAGNIGAVDLYGTASDMVAYFRQGRVENVPPLLDKLEGQLENVLNLILNLDRN